MKTAPSKAEAVGGSKMAGPEIGTLKVQVLLVAAELKTSSSTSPFEKTTRVATHGSGFAVPLLFEQFGSSVALRKT